MEKWEETVKKNERYRDIMFRAYVLGSHGEDFKLSINEIDEILEISHKAGVREVVDWIKAHSILVADNQPQEGKSYIYLGSYILKWGKEAEPSYGFYELQDTKVWQAQLKEWGIEE